METDDCQFTAPVVALIENKLLQLPVARRIAIEYHQVAGGAFNLSKPFDRDNVTVDDMVHGGVLAMADICGVAAAVRSCSRIPLGGATSGMSISYFAPAKGEDLSAAPFVFGSGCRQTVCRVTIAGECPVAEALVPVEFVFRVRRRSRRRTCASRSAQVDACDEWATGFGELIYGLE